LGSLDIENMEKNIEPIFMIIKKDENGYPLQTLKVFVDYMNVLSFSILDYSWNFDYERADLKNNPNRDPSLSIGHLPNNCVEFLPEIKKIIKKQYEYKQEMVNGYLNQLDVFIARFNIK